MLRQLQQLFMPKLEQNGCFISVEILVGFFQCLSVSSYLVQDEFVFPPPSKLELRISYLTLILRCRRTFSTNASSGSTSNDATIVTIVADGRRRSSSFSWRETFSELPSVAPLFMFYSRVNLNSWFSPPQQASHKTLFCIKKNEKKCCSQCSNEMSSWKLGQMVITCFLSINYENNKRNASNELVLSAIFSEDWNLSFYAYRIVVWCHCRFMQLILDLNESFSSVTNKKREREREQVVKSEICKL